MFEFFGYGLIVGLIFGFIIANEARNRGWLG